MWPNFVQKLKKNYVAYLGGSGQIFQAKKRERSKKDEEKSKPK